MCQLELPQVNRRNFDLLAVSALSISVFPWAARAAGHAEALAISCMDYRLVDETVKFFDDTLHLENEYDHVGLAGAALAAVSPKFPSSNAAFWDHVQIAKDLHHIKKVIVLDHRDCGAYKVAFGKDFASERAAETAQHKQVMMQLKTALGQKQPSLSSEYYLMALDGKAERII
ncbi:MAG: carbonic anhydrase [Alphaproteobacteria bacterium]